MQQVFNIINIRTGSVKISDFFPNFPKISDFIWLSDLLRTLYVKQELSGLIDNTISFQHR